MTDQDFDETLVTAAFALAADEGWHRVTAAAAARRAGLDMVMARERFGATGAILLKFGQIADARALAHALSEGPVRDRLFDTLMRRFDYLQAHRAGVVALFKYLPSQPVMALLLARTTVQSMGWLLEAAGEASTGPVGAVKARGLAVVWGLGVRAWIDDESEDLTATMAAVDTALNRADALVARFMPGRSASGPIVDEPFEVGAAAPAFPEDPSAVA
jgi:ubiquinone biosynthesis protein COQ9